MWRSIQLQLPLLLLLTGVLSIASLYAYLVRHEIESNQKDAIRSLNAAGTRLAGISEFLMQQDYDNALHMEFSLLAQFPDLTLAVVADANDHIIHASQPAWHHRTLSESPLAVANSLFSQARETLNSRTGTFNKGRLIVGVYAFQLPLEINSLTSTNSGVVVMGIDQTYSIAAARQEARRVAILAGLALLFLTLALWRLLHRLITQPIQSLVNTTRTFEEGNLFASANINNSNEMGELSDALDNLAETARERELVQQKNRRLAHIVEHSANEIYVANAETFLLIDANQTARKNLGYAEEEILSLYPWDFVQGMSRDNINEMIAPLLDGTINVATFETIHKRKNGTTYPVSTRLQYLSNQEPPVFSAIVEDITELQHQQAELNLRDRAIAEMDVGLLITDATQQHNPIVYANAAIEKITGHSVSELMGCNPRMLRNSDNDNDQPDLDKIRNALREQVPVQALLRNYRKDGSQFMNELSISPVRNSAGVVTHFIGIQRDVTERIATDARLLQAQRIDAIGQLSGGVAHDFNNLLTVIIGNLEFLKMDVNDPQLTEFVDEAESAAKMGARLTRRLLAFSSQNSLQPCVININQQVKTAMELLRSTIGEMIVLSSKLSSELWTTRSDPSEVENMIVNLSINARDAMPNGGLIQIETHNITVCEKSTLSTEGITPGDYVKLSVSDNGHGMTDEVKNRIFEPFYTTKPEGKGTGLGLASIYGFAQQSGGHITVESEIDVGTAFHIFLPRSEIDNQLSNNKSNASSTEAETKKQRVLAVGDNVMALKMTEKRLRTLGFETTTASNGEAAIHKLDAEKSIDLVLSDVELKGEMSGYDVGAWVHANRPNCRLLLTPEPNEQTTEGNEINLSRITLLVKPYNIEELKQAINKAFSNNNSDALHS